MRADAVRLAGLLVIVALLVAAPVAAEEASPAGVLEQGVRAELERERAARDRLESELDELRTLVEALRQENESGQAEMESLRDAVESLETEQLRAYRGSGGPAAGAGGEVGIDKREDRQYQEAERQVLEQRRGVLLPAGQLLFEPGVQYVNTSRDRVQLLSGFSLIPAIIIGRIDVVEIDRDIFQAFLNTRYGITNWLEADVSVPYFYRRDHEIFGARGIEEQVDITGQGIGDISGGLFAQVLYEKGWIPDTVVSFRFSAPTGEDFTQIDLNTDGSPAELPLGSGFWGLQGGVTFSKTTDPAVVFTSFRYTWNLEETKNGIRYDPGDTFEFSGGLAFALNERIAMSFTYQHRYTNEFVVAGSPLLRSDANSGIMFLGMSYTLNRWTAVSFNVGIGITQDAPDLTFEIRLPLRMPFRTPVLKFPRMPWQSAKGGTQLASDGRRREVLLD